MYVIFIFPLVASVVVTFIIIADDFRLWTKAIFLAIAIVAAALQLIPQAREHVHFLVPLFMQIFVCLWWWGVNSLRSI